MSVSVSTSVLKRAALAAFAPTAALIGVAIQSATHKVPDIKAGTEIKTGLDVCIDTGKALFCEKDGDPGQMIEDIQSGKMPRFAQQAQPAKLDLVEERKNGDHVYRIAGKDVTVGKKLRELLEREGAKGGIPLPVMIATCARESGCDPKAINPDSKACGLYQHMPKGSWPEGVKRFSESLGFGGHEKLVTRYIKARDDDDNPIYGYKPANKKAAAKLQALCQNATYNTRLFVHNMSRNIEKFERATGREIAIGEVVAMNNLGERGLRIMTSYAQEKPDMSAKIFFREKAGIFGKIDSDDPLISHQGKTLTIRQSLERVIFNHGGAAPIARFR